MMYYAKMLTELVTRRELTANTSLQLANGSYMAAGVGVVRWLAFMCFGGVLKVYQNNF